MSASSGEFRTFPTILVPTLIVSSLVMFGILQSEAPLETGRPASPERPGREARSDGTVEARLWQDPLSAIHDADFKTRGPDPCRDSGVGHSPDAWKRNLGNRALTSKCLKLDLEKHRDAGAKRLVVLAVPLPGTQYGENVETRIRLRYAVLAGLSVQGLTPELGTRLGAVDLQDVLHTAEQTHANRQNPLRDSADQGRTTDHSARAYYEDVLAHAATLTLGLKPQRARSCVRWILDTLFLEEPAEETPARGNPFLCAFEWHTGPVITKRDGKPDAKLRTTALVLWFNQQPVRTCLLEFLEVLRARLACAPQSGQPTQPSAVGGTPRTQTDEARRDCPCELICIGPLGSGVMLEIRAEDLRRTLQNANPPSVDGVEMTASSSPIKFFSPRATMAEEAAARKLKERLRQRGGEVYDEQIEAQSAWFYRTIADDRAVLDALVRELDLRGIDMERAASETPHNVVFVSEWDSVYGRELARTFVESARRYVNGQRSRNSCDNSESGDFNPSLIVFNYLRGIDGGVPRRSSTGKSAQASGAEQSTLAAKGHARLALPQDPTYRRPEGTSQFDYLRRTAARLRALNQVHRIEAVGVVGSDVYDKLLIFRALRPALPDALFFTTDLDAQYTHPDEQDWTRNLIVASGFGLTLGDDWQHGMPPFRENYQTSTFYAVQCALSGSPPDAADQALTFEIGRSRAYQLNGPAQDSERSGGPGVSASGDTSAPSPWLLVAALLVLIVLIVLGRTLRRITAKLVMHPVRALIAVLVCVTFIALWRAASWDHRQPDGEPFLWLEGISAWPAQFIRLTAGLLSISFWFGARIRLNKCVGGLTKQYFPELIRRDREGEAAKKQLFLWTQFRSSRLKTYVDNIGRFVRGSWLTLFPPPPKYRQETSEPDRKTKEPQRKRKPRTSRAKKQKPAYGGELWEWYLRQRSLKVVVRALFLSLLLYFIAAAIIFQTFGHPVHPIRGDYLRFVNVTILWLNLIPFYLLLFLVHYETCLAMEVVWHILRARTKRSCHTVDAILQPRRAAPRAEAQEMADIDENAAAEAKAGLDSIRLTAELTRVVGRLVVLPFVVLLLMIFSRSQVFDAWRWPLALLIVICFVLALCLYAALALRFVARRSRNQLADVWQKLCDAVAMRRRSSSERVTKYVDLIKSERTGAFGPFGLDPVLQALLIPSGGLGLLTLLDQFFPVAY